MSALAMMPLERIQVTHDTLLKLMAYVKTGVAEATTPEGYSARARETAAVPDVAGLRELDARIWLDIFKVLDQQGMADHKARLALMLNTTYDLTLVR